MKILKTNKRGRRPVHATHLTSLLVCVVLGLVARARFVNVTVIPSSETPVENVVGRRDGLTFIRSMGPGETDLLAAITTST